MTIQAGKPVSYSGKDSVVVACDETQDVKSVFEKLVDWGVDAVFALPKTAEVRILSKCSNCGAPGQVGQCEYCGVRL